MNEIWRLDELELARRELEDALDPPESGRVEEVCARYAHVTDALVEFCLNHLQRRERQRRGKTGTPGKLALVMMDEITNAILREDGARVREIIHSYPPPHRMGLLVHALRQFAIAYPLFSDSDEQDILQDEEERDEIELERFELTLGDEQFMREGVRIQEESEMLDLTDEQWAEVEPVIAETTRHAGGRGRPRLDDRSILNGILWVLRNGARWEDLPDRYPSDKTCNRRYREWRDNGTLERIEDALAEWYES